MCGADGIGCHSRNPTGGYGGLATVAPSWEPLPPVLPPKRIPWDMVAVGIFLAWAMFDKPGFRLRVKL